MDTGSHGQAGARHRRLRRDRRRVRPPVRGRGRRGGRPLPPRPRAGRGDGGRAGGARVAQRRPHRRGRGRAAVRRGGPLDVCAAIAGVWPSGRRAGCGAVARALARDARREPDRDVPDRARLPRAARRPRGRLVLVGSTAGIFGEAGHADYAAAKARDPRRAPALAEERGRPRRPARARQRRRAGLDGVADDPRRHVDARAGAADLADDGAAQGRRGRRTSPRRSSRSPRPRSPATSRARSSTVAGGMEGRVLHE